MSADDDTPPPGVAVPVTWTGAEDMPVLFANHFVAQVDRGEVFLTAGQLTPPMLVGTQEERIEQAGMIQFLPIQTVARIGFTPDRLRELIQVLEITLQNYETQETHFGDPRNH
jgi:hypothetical protein